MIRVLSRLVAALFVFFGPVVADVSAQECVPGSNAQQLESFLNDIDDHANGHTTIMVTPDGGSFVAVHEFDADDHRARFVGHYEFHRVVGYGEDVRLRVSRANGGWLYLWVNCGLPRCGYYERPYSQDLNSWQANSPYSVELVRRGIPLFERFFCSRVVLEAEPSR